MFDFSELQDLLEEQEQVQEEIENKDTSEDDSE